MQNQNEKLKGFRGTISNVDISQLLQMISFGEHSLMVKVMAGGKEGVFFLKDGQVIHAETNNSKEGEDAFKEIALWEGSTFEISPLQLDGIPITIAKPWEYLALEMARLRDEVESRKIKKVLIVDDSTFFARQLKQILEEDSSIRVVGIAGNGEEALDYIEDEHIDVVTLDVFMPVMAGDTTLKHLMLRYGIPVIILSAFLEGSANHLFDFMRLGAVEIFPKPKGQDNISQYGLELRRLIKKVATAKVRNFKIWRPPKEVIANLTSPVPYSVTSEPLTVIVGGEGSHVDWFRLPLLELSKKTCLIGFSTVESEFLAPLAGLIEKYKGIGVRLSKNEKENIYSNSLNLLSAYRLWNFSVDDDSLHVTSSSFVNKINWMETVEQSILGLAEIFKNRLFIFCLSGGEDFSERFLKTVSSNQVTFLLPSLENLLLTDMAESVVVGLPGYDRTIKGSYQGLMEELERFKTPSC